MIGQNGAYYLLGENIGRVGAHPAKSAGFSSDCWMVAPRVRPRRLIPVLLSVALLSLGALLAQSQQHPERSHEPAQRREPAPQAQELQRSLSQIGGYKIGIEGWQREHKGKKLNLIETINAFRVRKRGRYYGSIYEFHRNDNFDARNFFDPVGESLPEFKRNQFGGSLGASLTPGLKLFGTYDGLRIIQGSTILSHVPTPAERRGDFSASETPLIDPLTGQPFPGNVIPQARIHPVALGLLPVIPDPILSDPDRNYLNSAPKVENSDTLGFRVDYDISSQRKLFADYRRSTSNRVNAAAFPEFGSTSLTTNHRLSLNYNWTLSERMVSSFGLTFQRNVNLQLSPHSGQSGLASSFGINGISPLDELDEGYPDFRIAGYGGGSGPTLGDDGNLPRGQTENFLTFRGSFNLNRGDHHWSFGGEIQFEQLNNARSQGLHRGRFTYNGEFTGDAFADFLLGIPDSATRGVGSERGDVRGRRGRVFLVDDWKIDPRLSLSLALAYSYATPHKSTHDNISFFYPLLFIPPRDGEIVVTGSERAAELGLGDLDSGQGFFPDRNDWEPRLGLAYSPFGNNKLVVRASYQVSHFASNARRLAPWFGKNYPFFFQQRSDSSPSFPEIDISNPFEALTPTELNIRSIDPGLRNESRQDWRLSVQNEILQNWTLELSYIGRKQGGIATILYGNTPLAGPGTIQSRRPNPDFGQFEIGASRGSAVAHSFEANLVKRLSDSFSLRSSFRWGRTFTDRSRGGIKPPSNPYNIRAERGASEDPPLRFSVNYLWELPFGHEKAFPLTWLGRLRGLVDGWRISGITSFVSGSLFEPVIRGDFNNDGLSNDRPDRLGSGLLPASQRSIDKWFATEDFALPAPYTYGNSGRTILVGPGEQVWDISLTKVNRFGDGKSVEFRVEFFNALNHPNFDNPVNSFGTSVFGKIFGAQRAREIEIALKFSF